MNMRMKRLVAGATIAAALGGTATGIGAGISSAAPARPPAISAQVGHGGPPPQAAVLADRVVPPSPQDHPGGPGGPPADNRGPGDHGGPRLQIAWAGVYFRGR